VHVEPSAKRVRAYLGGEVAVDSVRPLLVWESPHYPTYYFPVADVCAQLLPRGEESSRSPSRGDAEVCDVAAIGRVAAAAALRYLDSPIAELRGTVRFKWDAMDAWFEEDEEVFTHARNPYTRIEILQSSRRVRVAVEGSTVADSRAPRLLFETGLPVRYYLPKPHVHMDLLIPTETISHCPYKGQAEYWSVRIGEELHRDLAWSYPTPLLESTKIAGLVCFWNDRVELDVEGPPRKA
jgi:uncharacterized protein (DUF427 family)